MRIGHNQEAKNLWAAQSAVEEKKTEQEVAAPVEQALEEVNDRKKNSDNIFSMAAQKGNAKKAVKEEPKKDPLEKLEEKIEEKEEETKYKTLYDLGGLGWFKVKRRLSKDSNVPDSEIPRVAENEKDIKKDEKVAVKGPNDSDYDIEKGVRLRKEDVVKLALEQSEQHKKSHDKHHHHKSHHHKSSHHKSHHHH